MPNMAARYFSLKGCVVFLQFQFRKFFTKIFSESYRITFHISLSPSVPSFVGGHKDSLVYTGGFIFQVDSVPLPRVLTSLLPRLRSLHLKVGWRGRRGGMLIIIRLPTRSVIVVTD